MSTDILYHALGLKGHEIVHETICTGEIILYIEPLEETLRCPACGSCEVIRRGRFERALCGLAAWREATNQGLSNLRQTCDTTCDMGLITQ